MALTYSAIATVTVDSGGSATMEFTSIPNTYTDLLIKVSPRLNTDGVYAITFNSNTSNYSGKTVRGNGASVASYSVTDYQFGSGAIGIGYISGTSSTFANGEIYIPNYTSSNNKTISADHAMEQNLGTPIWMNLTAGLWSNTSVISSIQLKTEIGLTFAQYSTATLYGIKNTV